MNNKTILKDIAYKSYLPEGELKQVVVGIHGFAGDKESSVLDTLKNSLIKDNVGLICFDLPCHGENKTNKCLSLSDCIESTNCVIEFAHSFGVPVSVFATSFGAYLVLLYLSNHNNNFKHIILRCPAVFMDEVFTNVILPEHGYDVKSLSHKVNLGYGTPLYVDNRFLKELIDKRLADLSFNKININVIQGKRDDVVNWEQNELFFKKKFGKNCKFYYFEKADHRFKNPGELEKIVEISKKILLGK